MYLAQLPRTPGVQLVGIADLAPATVSTNLARVGWEPSRSTATSLDHAVECGLTHVGDDWRALSRIRASISSSSARAIRSPRSSTASGHSHTESTWWMSRSRQMRLRTVARAARSRGRCRVLLAFGDQPALIATWSIGRVPAASVVAAAAATNGCRIFANPCGHRVGLLRFHAGAGGTRGLNPKMFDSFLDGSKPAIECTAVANATGLAVPSNGLTIHRQALRTFRS